MQKFAKKYSTNHACNVHVMLLGTTDIIYMYKLGIHLCVTTHYLDFHRLKLHMGI